MRIDHVAIWVTDLEKLKNFYEQYFNARSGEKYHNPKTKFTSYFLSFAKGARLEIMQKDTIPKNLNDVIQQYIGLNHLAVSVGSKEKVDQMTERLRNDGYKVISEPRTTGDGYYESVILDPEQNRLEITI